MSTITVACIGHETKLISSDIYMKPQGLIVNKRFGGNLDRPPTAYRELKIPFINSKFDRNDPCPNFSVQIFYLNLFISCVLGKNLFRSDGVFQILITCAFRLVGSRLSQYHTLAYLAIFLDSFVTGETYSKQGQRFS